MNEINKTIQMILWGGAVLLFLWLSRQWAPGLFSWISLLLGVCFVAYFCIKIFLFIEKHPGDTVLQTPKPLFIALVIAGLSIVVWIRLFTYPSHYFSWFGESIDWLSVSIWSVGTGCSVLSVLLDHNTKKI